jgi:hypothetical protein
MHSLSKRVFVVVFFALISLQVTFAQSAGAAGMIEGKVVDPSGALVPGATVEIRNPVTGFVRTATTDEGGTFALRNIPLNPYHMVVTAKGFNATVEDVDVRSGVPIELNIKLGLENRSETVEVTATAGDLLESDVSAHTDLDEHVAARIPLQRTGSGLSQLITSVSPGVAADSNDFFHPLGDHAQAQFSIDNQSVTDQQTRVYSNQISSNAIQSMELVTGVAPAEYGDKTSLIAVVTTKSGLGLQKPMGSVSAGYGSFGAPTADLTLGLGTSKVGNFVSISGMRSGRYLDTPEFQPLHDIGNSANLFDRLDFQPRPSDSFHANFFVARSWFQVPNTFDQQAAGQDQRQQMYTFNIAPSWTHLFNPTTLLTANAFVRQDRVNYYPSSNLFADQPETAALNRHLTNSGARLDLSYVKGHHTVKTGFQYLHTSLLENFRFGITDATVNPVCLDSNGDPVPDPTITNSASCDPLGFTANPNLNPALVPFDLTRGGGLFNFHQTGGINEEAGYIQDNMTFGKFTAMTGLRFEYYDGLTSKSQAEPRIGLSYRIGKTNTVLRGSYARTMESPYNENLLLSGSSQVAQIFGSTSDVTLKPGTRNQFNAGFQQALGRFAVLDADYFWKYTRNGFDFNVLGDTPIAFPISWNKSKLDGFSIRLTSADLHGFRWYTTLGHTRARYFNPESGGLFFDQVQPTGVFRIDHDQALQSTTNLQYSFWKGRGGWTTFTWRYDSGLVAGSVPDFATALTLTPDQQAAIGVFCGSAVATRDNPITSCDNAVHGAKLLRIPADGTEDDDKNPPRVAPRHLFDAGVGFDNLFATERTKWKLNFTVINLTNKTALYNFLSTFSGTHFVSPRSYQAELGFTF